MQTANPNVIKTAAAIRMALCLLAPLGAFLPAPVHGQAALATDPRAARPGSVEGLLVSPPGSHNAIEGVSVTIVETGQSERADKFGHYAFSNVPPGTYTIVATGKGFSRLKITDVVVQPNHTLTLGAQEMPIVMKDGEVQMMEEVVVTASKVEKLGEYVVEESRQKAFLDQTVTLPRNADEEQPYYIMTSDRIENAGVTNIEQLFQRTLSMNVDMRPYGAGVGTSYGQASTINLRGLGTNETLILLDGRRLPNLSLSSTAPQPDVNGIPLAAIDRIEVLPSSSAAIYGGSAIGGVINIILKKNYTGGNLQFTYDTPATAHAPQETIDATYGLSLEGGKTHVMITAEYADGSPLKVGQRSVVNDRQIQAFQRGSYFSSTPNPIGQYLFSNSVPYYGGTTGNIVLYPSSYVFDSKQPAATNPSTSSLTFKNGASLNSLHTYIPFGVSPTTSLATLQAGLLANAGQFNFGWGDDPETFGKRYYLGYVDRRKSLQVSVRREMTPWLSAFAQVYTASNHGMSNYDPFGFGVIVPSTYAINPFAQNVYVGVPAKYHAWNVNGDITQQASFGLTAKLPRGWTGEFDYTWGQTITVQRNDYFDGPALQAAMQAGAFNPFVDVQQNPVDLNQFDSVPADWRYPSTTNDIQAHVSGPVFHLPGGDSILTIGIENRKEGTHTGFNRQGPLPNTPYTGINGSEATLTNIATFFGHAETIQAAYLEVELPLVSKKNAMLGIHGLSLQFAVTGQRYSSGVGPSYYYYYPLSPASSFSFPGTSAGPNIGSSTVNYTHADTTTGIKYSPVDGLTFRTSYATSFLPPTYNQIASASPPSLPTTSIIDPVTGGSVLVSTISGGNPDVKPQTSKSWDAGVIVEPHSGPLQGLRIDLEFYSIVQPNYIEAPTAQQVVSDPNLLGRVTRNSSGQITSVNITYLNVNEYKTDGYDLTVDYTRKTPVGTFEFTGTGTIIEHEKRQAGFGRPFQDYVGWANSGGEPKTKGSATLTYAAGSWVLGWTTRYLDGYNQFGVLGDPLLYYPGSVYNTIYPNGYTYYSWIGGSRIPQQIYHDVFAKYSFGKGAARALLSNVDVTIGIKDLFNSVPPFDPYINAPSWSSAAIQDLRLREWWVQIRKNF
jgi:outer membrane cobalamin receptor